MYSDQLFSICILCRFTLRALYLYYKCWITLWPCTDNLMIAGKNNHACATAAHTFATGITLVQHQWAFVQKCGYMYIYRISTPPGLILLASACRSAIIASLEPSVLFRPNLYFLCHKWGPNIFAAMVTSFTNGLYIMIIKVPLTCKIFIAEKGVYYQ